MIAWAIEAAIESACFDRVVVSTDDAEITAVARGFGAEVPFIRPAALSSDHAGTAEVVAHAIEWFAAAGQPVDAACCLYATAAFVQPSDLREGLRLLQSGSCEFALAVAPYVAPVQRALRLGSDGLHMLHPEYRATRSQDLEPAYHDAGQFCWGLARAWLQSAPLQAATSAVLLPMHRVQDIDTPEDWERAQAMFMALAAESGSKAARARTNEDVTE